MSRNGADDGLKEEILNLMTSGKAKVKDVDSRTRELFGSSSSEDDDEVEAFEEIKKSSPATKVLPRKSSLKKKAIAQYSSAEFSDGYDEDFYGDDADRAKLMGMTEIEREAVLYERAQARQARAERKELERKVRDLELQEQQKLESAKQRSQRAPSSSVEKKRKTLGKLKALREKRHKRATGESDQGSYDSDEDAYEDGEVLDVDNESDEATEESEYEDSDEEVYAKKPAYKQKEEISSKTKKTTTQAEPITFEMANKIRLSRDLIAKWIYHPDFDDLARNSLIRLAIGNGPDGQQVYRLVEVKKIVPYYRAYKIGGPNGTSSINKAAILRYGKSERTFRLDVVSNSDFTAREFERWMSNLVEEKQAIPSLRSSKAKSEAWEAFRDQPVSDEIIQAMIKAKKDLGQGHRNLVAEKTMLMHQREEAEASGNLEEIEQIDLELAELAKEIEESQSKKSVSSRRLEALAEINKRNRQANIAIAREAERLMTSYQTSVSKDSKHDPFSRRRCQPSNDVFGEEDANTPSAPEPVKAESEKVREEPISQTITPVPQSQSQVLDLFAAHNVDIDIDI